jgi:hypothetical protein
MKNSSTFLKLFDLLTLAHYFRPLFMLSVLESLADTREFPLETDSLQDEVSSHLLLS